MWVTLDRLINSLSNYWLPGNLLPISLPASGSSLTLSVAVEQVVGEIYFNLLLVASVGVCWYFEWASRPCIFMKWGGRPLEGDFIRPPYLHQHRFNRKPTGVLSDQIGSKPNLRYRLPEPERTGWGLQP